MGRSTPRGAPSAAARAWRLARFGVGLIVALQVILGSASPARLATLRSAGVNPKIIVSDVDEDALLAAAGPQPVADLVALLARAKAETVVAQRAASPARALVIGCDSMLEFDGKALGKPETPKAAKDRWRAMRGKHGILHTGHSIALLAQGRRSWAHGTSSADVAFADLSDAEIDAYIATGEPLAVAGAFTIDGLGGWFVRSIDGDHHGVVGISLPLVRDLIGQLGLSVTDLWA